MNFIDNHQSVMDESTLTPRQLSEAEWFPFSYNKIRALVRSGELPAINVTKGTKRATYLVREKDARRFVESLYS